VSETRKLAAILVSDVVGYSRLAGADEDRILARLRTLRSDLIDPTIAVHHGRIIKRTGDGSIIEFRSVVDAVNCAIEVQRAMVERNAEVAPDKRIEFRIGIHLGDVVEESDGDLMGDGVNIAARLQGVAKPGAICLSEDAYRQVKGRLELAVADLGLTQLKNITEPVRVYALDVGKRAEAQSAKPAVPALTKKNSLLAPVVLGVASLCVIASLSVWVPFLMLALARAEARTGDIGRALATLDEGLAASERTSHPAFDAELYRARGEILLERHPSNPAPAEEALLAAIAIAEQQGMRSFGLRAALSLAKLYQSTGRPADAHAALVPALEGFSPTPEMPEIEEAEELLAAWSARDGSARR
jgi:class 3 adenylate cyclase